MDHSGLCINLFHHNFAVAMILMNIMDYERIHRMFHYEMFPIGMDLFQKSTHTMCINKFTTKFELVPQTMTTNIVYLNEIVHNSNYHEMIVFCRAEQYMFVANFFLSEFRSIDFLYIYFGKFIWTHIDMVKKWLVHDYKRQCFLTTIYSIFTFILSKTIEILMKKGLFSIPCQPG